MAVTIALVSLKGGVGRTTIAAHLAGTIAQAGRRCLAVDLDPQNALQFHFGYTPGTQSGIVDAELDVAAWQRRVAGMRGESACIPFSMHVNHDPAVVANPAHEGGEGLRRRLVALGTAAEFIIVDTPAYRSPWLLTALDHADLVVVLVAPEPACFAAMPATEMLLQQVRAHRPGGVDAYYVVNRFDGGHPLARDVSSALRAGFGDRVLPVAIRQDAVVSEALARQRTVLKEATDSQMLVDLGELANWIHGTWETKRARRAVRA